MRLLDYAKFVFAKSTGQLKCSYYPFYYWLEITNVCNENCLNCMYLRSRRAKKVMSLEEFKIIADRVNCKGTTFYLFMLGEPLLHPNLFKIVELLNRRKAIIKINTNISLLSKNMSEEILSSDITSIVFSLNEYSVHESGLDKERFRDKIDKVAQFLMLKRKYSKKIPYTGVNYMTNITSNILSAKEKKEVITRLYSLGLDKFDQEYAHDFCGQIPLLGYNLKKEENKKLNVCMAAWGILGILVDGTVVPCCLDTEKTYPLGNIFNQNLETIWNGPKMCLFRKKIFRKKFNDLSLCANCHITHSRKVRKYYIDEIEERIRVLFKKI